MNISLPEDLKKYVEQRAKHGYSTPSEFVRELIREDRRKRARDRLVHLLEEGLQSGEPIVADARFWSDLKREARARSAGRRTKPRSR
jgi:antitoxin ParD1/3/4